MAKFAGPDFGSGAGRVKALEAARAASINFFAAGAFLALNSTAPKLFRTPPGAGRVRQDDRAPVCAGALHAQIAHRRI